MIEHEPIPKPHLYKHDGRWWVAIERGYHGDGGYWTFAKACREARLEWVRYGGAVA